jgi:hypothetical protein
MFDLLHIPPYTLFLHGVRGSAPRNERTQRSVNGSKYEDLLKNRETVAWTIEGRKKKTTKLELDNECFVKLGRI